ncbi:MAG: peptidoglycan bridge formation glycyltransferase FemA/FemB family protein [Candidatus Aminicenantales bacterium]
MRAEPVAINWHSGLPIFACESFLKAVGDEYGWLGGFAESGELRCILPYTIIQKMFFRMVRFRVETIPLGEELDIREEKAFLESAMEYFRSIGADMVIPAANNAIFRTYPDGADAAPYGSYVIDLCRPEDILWRNIDRITRQNIKTAQKNGISIRSGLEHLDAAYMLVRDTFRRSKLSFMSLESFKRFVLGLGENGKIMMADYQGVAQSYVVFAFSDYCAFAIYAGNIVNQHQGANKLLYWEAIRLFQSLGVQLYDFMGARVDPEKGSKQEALSLFKKRFGARLKQGYMWKYPLHPWKYRLYCLAARLRRGGDIVDAERHKLKSFSGPQNN